MLAFIVNKISDLDQFAYDPEKALVYKKNKQFPTFPGGCLSIFLGFAFGGFWYWQLFQMFNFENNSTSSNTT